MVVLEVERMTNSSCRETVSRYLLRTHIHDMNGAFGRVGFVGGVHADGGAGGREDDQLFLERDRFTVPIVRREAGSQRNKALTLAHTQTIHYTSN